MRRGLLLAAVAVSVGCAGDGSFECQSDTQCSEGRCESIGFCSFPDAECLSGQRYGALAGGGLAGQCVPLDSGTGEVQTGTGTVPSTSSGPTVGTVSDETAVAETCSLGTVCHVAAPPGWNGPAVVQPLPEACPSDAPIEFVTVYAGLIAPDPICTCSCAAAVLCSEVMLYQATEAACVAGTPYDGLVEGECAGLVAGGDEIFVEWNLPDRGCEPSGTAEILPLGWESAATLCATDNALQCNDGVCLPGERACIYREGDRDCPAGEYPEREVRYADAQDDRDCTACTCGAAPSCDVATYGLDGCAGRPLAQANSADGDGCIPGSAGNSVLLSVQGNCEASPSQPTGSATATNPITLCCTSD